jgi:ketosteroid isomerase-like protein
LSSTEIVDIRFSVKTTQILRILALLLLILAPVGSLRAADIDALKRSLATADEAWSAAAVARDAAKVATGYYAEDGIAYPPDAPIAVGRAATAKIWTDGFSDPTYNVSWKAIRVEVSESGDIGITSGTYVESYKGSDGKLVTNHGKYVCIWRRNKDGQWKAVDDIWNADGK